MAHIHRIIALLVLCMGWNLAHASFTNHEFRHPNDGTGSWYGSRGAACSGMAAWDKATATGNYRQVKSVDEAANLNPGRCEFDYISRASGSVVATQYESLSWRNVATCPANSTGSTTCTCAAGYTETNTGGYVYACVDPIQQACDMAAGTAPNTVSCTGSSCAFFGARGSDEACITGAGATSGCVVKGEMDMSWPSDESNPSAPWGVRMSNVKYTGAKCSTDTTPAPGGETPQQNENLQPDNQGKCPGEVNGVTVWKECSWSESGTKKTESKTTTNPDGTTTTTDGTTTTKTECKDGKCTTTTTTSSTKDGQTTTSSGTVTTGKGEYCKANPSDPQCSDEGGWAGTCEAGFQCSGDPVQCAAAKGVWLQKCALIDAESPEKTLYKSIKDGTATGGELNSTTTGIGPGSFNQTNALGTGGACITDQVVTVWGTTLTLGFSAVCPYLQQLGQLMLAISFLAATFIVFRRG